jgi:hypothetical protein
MSNQWRVTLLDEAGNAHSGLRLVDVIGSFDRPDWRGKLTGGIQLRDIQKEVSLRIEDGDEQGRVAQIRFTGGPGGVEVYGLSGFVDRSG